MIFAGCQPRQDHKLKTFSLFYLQVCECHQLQSSPLCVSILSGDVWPEPFDDAIGNLKMNSIFQQCTDASIISLMPDENVIVVGGAQK